MAKIKVLVIDDSELIRQTISALFKNDEFIDIVGEATNPFDSLEKIQNAKPEVLLLDIQMPKMDGLTFLKNIIKQKPMPVVIFSSFAEEGSENALKAFEYGAVSVIEKPKLKTEGEIIKYKEKLASALITAKSANISSISKLQKTSNKAGVNSKLQNQENPNYIVAIGASTGGTEAIKWLLQEIPKNFPPIVITQHMPVGFTNSFANRLDSLSKIKVKEAENFEELKTGHAYIAKGDRHLTIEKNAGIFKLILNDAPELNRHKPAIDIMFESISENFKENVIGILLTGMGEDGAKGLKTIKENGAYTIAQDEETSVIFGMPKAAIVMGIVDEILPIYKITETLIRIINKKMSVKN